MVGVGIEGAPSPPAAISSEQTDPPHVYKKEAVSNDTASMIIEVDGDYFTISLVRLPSICTITTPASAGIVCRSEMMSAEAMWRPAAS